MNITEIENAEIKSDPFVDQIMRAIVNQFFENPQIIPGPQDGWVQQRSTPAQIVTARLLAEKQGELIAKIMERIDHDACADQVAEKVKTILLSPNSASVWNRDPDDIRRDKIKKAVDERVVELLAQKMLADMKDETGE